MPKQVRYFPALSLVAALLLGATAAQAGICHTQNLMPDFFAFEARTNGLTPQARAALFVKDFAPRHRDFYTEDEFGAAALSKSALRFFDPSRPIALPGFAPLTDANLRAVAQQIEPAFEKAQNEFAKTFPDFACTADISFGVSLLHFDGHGYTDSHGDEHMRFGIDMIALLHQPQDLPAFFAHELFHIYHAQILQGAHPEDDKRTWWAMWEEGLATYMSRQMNLPLSEQQVLWFPTDLAAQMQKPGMMAKTARMMLADFDTTGNYAEWFQAGHNAPGLPSRAGYFMGLRMAEELAHDYTLQQLAHMKPREVEMHAKAFLIEQAQ